MDIIDLSHTIHDDIQIYPGDPAPSIKRGLTHEKDYCHVDVLTLGSHTGTHIDAPFHFFKEGKRIDELPVQRFVGDGVLVDVSGKSDWELIEPEDVGPYKTVIKKRGQRYLFVFTPQVKRIGRLTNQSNLHGQLNSLK